MTGTNTSVDEAAQTSVQTADDFAALTGSTLELSQALDSPPQSLADLNSEIARASNPLNAVAGKVLFILMDYDGTTVMIVSRPEDAMLDDEGRDMIEALGKASPYPLGFVSGRSISQLSEFLKDVKDTGLLFAGLHGSEIKDGRTGEWILHPNDKIAHHAFNAGSHLQSLVDEFPGLLLEPKSHTVAAHYRLCKDEDKAEASRRIKAEMDKYVEEHNLGGVMIAKPGKMVWELTAADCDKGSAIEKLCTRLLSELRKLDPDAELPHVLYLGDDVTDEAGFAMVNSLGGTSIRVGDPISDTSAQYSIDTVTGVREFFHNYLESLRSPPELQ